jgi:hypothetical protein
VRASCDEHRASGLTTSPVVAVLAAAALLAACLTLGIGSRIADQPDADRHHAATSMLDDLATAVIPAAATLVALLVAWALVLLTATAPEPAPTVAHRGRAPPRRIDI